MTELNKRGIAEKTVTIAVPEVKAKIRAEEPCEEAAQEDNKSERIYDTQNNFCVDIAKTGKAKCRQCKKQIEKNLLRVGKYITFKGKIVTLFYHPDCAFALFEKAQHCENFVQDLSEFDGIESINNGDREILAAAIEKCSEVFGNQPSG